MRLARFEHRDQTHVGYYFDDHVVPLDVAARRHEDATHRDLALADSTDLLDYLPPAGTSHAAAVTIHDWLTREGDSASAGIPSADVKLLVPVPRPNKLFLLAGNYAAHIEEGGGIAAERAETFPYVFMKPPTTTLTHPGDAVRIPQVSPDAIDWELELAVVIGAEARAVSESEALDYVAGYTIVNDISNRRFRPNPSRKERDKDRFFDWLHGKWHDSFCPCGPCVASADDLTDPQSLGLRLTVDGEVKQQASTAQQIFPVAAVIEFVSSIVTLEPGDLISTGTPAGVGSSSGTFLRAGQTIEASIESIGTLVSPVLDG